MVTYILLLIYLDFGRCADSVFIDMNYISYLNCCIAFIFSLVDETTLLFHIMYTILNFCEHSLDKFNVL